MIGPFDKRIDVRVVTHYDKHDVGFRSDYVYIEIFVQGEEEPAHSFGDRYHDKGQEKAIGFILGLEYVYGEENVNVVWEDVADYEE